MRSSVVQGIFSGSWVLLGGGNICYISAIELICIGVIEMFLQLLCLCCLLSLIAFAIFDLAVSRTFDISELGATWNTNLFFT